MGLAFFWRCFVIGMNARARESSFFHMVTYENIKEVKLRFFRRYVVKHIILHTLLTYSFCFAAHPIAGFTKKRTFTLGTIKSLHLKIIHPKDYLFFPTMWFKKKIESQ